MNTITFTESGLPSGTTWSVTFNGITEILPAPSCVTASDSSDTLCTNVLYPAVGQQVTLTGSFPDGSSYAAAGYNYGIYIYNSTSGAMIASCVSDSKSCSATFTYDGIVHGYYAEFLYHYSGWYSFDTLSNLQVAQYPTSSNSISFQSIQSGTYSWSVPGTISCGSGCQYAASASSGSISVSSSTTVNIQYTEQYDVTTYAEQLPLNGQIVESTTCSGSGTCSFPSPLTQGDVIVVGITGYYTGPESCVNLGISDTRALQFNPGLLLCNGLVVGSTQYDTYGMTWTATVTSGGADTITVSGGIGSYGLVLYEVSGVTTTGELFGVNNYPDSWVEQNDQYFSIYPNSTSAVPGVVMGFLQSIGYGYSTGPGYTTGHGQSEYNLGVVGTTEVPFTNTGYSPYGLFSTCPTQRSQYTFQRCATA